MLIIDSITEEARQRHLLPVEGYDEPINMLLMWRETQSGWFVDLSWGTWSVSGVRVCHLPNILASWANVIPFGIMVMCSNKQDPFLIQSFSNGTAQLFVLNADEVAELKATYG